MPSDLPRYYDILGVKNDASSSEIRRAFRKKALKLHPDKNPDRPDAADRFDEVNKAYELLSDAKLKREYDQKLSVELAREAKWAAENADVRAMREKLEARERQADERRRAKRRRAEEDRTKKQNRDIMRGLMSELAAEEADKDGLRDAAMMAAAAGASSSTSAPAGGEIPIRVRWKRSEGQTLESLRAVASRYGKVRVANGDKSRTAILWFARRRDAEDCLLGESGKNKAVKFSYMSSNASAQAAPASKMAEKITKPTESGLNPYASLASDPRPATATASSNPYAALFASSGTRSGKNQTEPTKLSDLDALEAEVLGRVRARKRTRIAS